VSNFLIVYVRAPPYIDDVDKVPTMVSKGRVTKQGVRDLNYYGPRGPKAVAEATVAATVADEKSAAEAQPPVIAAGGTDDAGASK